MTQYPQLHRLATAQSPHCSACERPATAGVMVSFSPLRKRSYSACERHVRIAQEARA